MQSGGPFNRCAEQSDGEVREDIDYVDVDGEQVYVALHRTKQAPKARVLLLGPFASERPHRYISWVRWARYLALHGYEALRFDYRGVGESTGRFEDFGFESWEQDALSCYELLRTREPKVPVVFHGLGMGALLAEHAFRCGSGDVLMLWQPPKSARDMLYQQLRIRLANDFVLQQAQRKTRDQYVREIEQGEVVEVEGFNWTQRLWREAAKYELLDSDQARDAVGVQIRPRIVSPLSTLAAHMFGGVGPNPIRQSSAKRKQQLVSPDLTSDFDGVLAQLDGALMQFGGELG